jgi:hypothetical protein
MSTGRPPPLLTASVQQYYADPDVRTRLLEYCGAVPGAPPSAVYVAVLHPEGRPFPGWQQATRVPAVALTEHLSLEGDLSRSLWDTRNLIFVLDLDYQNVDFPANPFLYPAETFVKLEPAYRATRQVLVRFGLSPLVVMTGRGYHFIGRIPLNDPAIDMLASLVPDLPGWYEGYRDRHSRNIDATLDVRQARAASGLGLLIEYLAHRILRRSARSSRVPVVVNGTVVGSGPMGRECVSLDFSHVGDPLDTRTMRIAFSTYQWHRFRPDIFGPECERAGTLVALPRRGRGLLSMLMSGRTLDAARRSARRTSTALPIVADGVRRLVIEYESSRLAAFHRTFYGTGGRGESRAPRVDLETLLPCVAVALNSPNDLLLKPEHLQHLTRALLTCGWTARQIAELVCEYYESDFGWGDRWAVLHPRSRAEFDVRVFAGLIAMGLDTMIDFNCVSAQEKDICPRVGCPHDLRTDRDAFLARGHS